MKGGVLFKTSRQHIIPELRRFSNGESEYVANGRYGVVLRLSASESTVLRNATCAIKNLLVKIVAIDTPQEIQGHAIKNITVAAFEEEVHIHQDVCERSLEKFHCSIAPTILYADIFTLPELEKLFPSIHKYIGREGRIGLIFMEMIEADDDSPAFTVHDYYNIPRNRPYVFTVLIPRARRLLIMLAQIGFLHNDFHLRNFLCQETPLVYIIDFGRATRISQEHVTLFNSYLDASDLSKMIPFLFGTKIAFMENPKYVWFQWLHKNSLEPYVRGFARTIAVTSQKDIVDPIRLKEEEMALCYLPPKISYSDRERLATENERLRIAKERESIKEQIRTKKIGFLNQPIFVKDKEFFIEFLKTNGYLLKDVPEFQQDKEVVLHAVQRDGLSLQYASPELQEDKEVVLNAVQRDGLSLQYASPELQADKEVVLHAVRENGFALQYTPLKDLDVIMAAVSQNYLAFQIVSELLDKEFVKKVLFLDGRCYPDIDDRLKDDPEIMAYARYSQIPFLFRFNPGAQKKIDTFLETHETDEIIMKRYRENYPPPPPSLGGKTRRKRILK
jgi:serine/threonine-protein kinase RIO1